MPPYGGGSSIGLLDDDGDDALLAGGQLMALPPVADGSQPLPGMAPMPGAPAGAYSPYLGGAAGYACDRVEHFRVDVGGLHVLGPTDLTHTRTCVAGQTCQIENLPTCARHPKPQTNLRTVKTSENAI